MAADGNIAATLPSALCAVKPAPCRPTRDAVGNDWAHFSREVLRAEESGAERRTPGRCRAFPSPTGVQPRARVMHSRGAPARRVQALWSWRPTSCLTERRLVGPSACRRPLKRSHIQCMTRSSAGRLASTAADIRSRNRDDSPRVCSGISAPARRNRRCANPCARNIAPMAANRSREIPARPPAR